MPCAGYSYRLCRMPSSGNFSELTESCFQRSALDFVGNSSFIEYTKSGERFEIDAMRTTQGTVPEGSMWTRVMNLAAATVAQDSSEPISLRFQNPIPNVGTGKLTPQGRDTWSNDIPTFPLPTFRGKVGDVCSLGYTFISV